MSTTGSVFCFNFESRVFVNLRIKQPAIFDLTKRPCLPNCPNLIDSRHKRQLLSMINGVVTKIKICLRILLRFRLTLKVNLDLDTRASDFLTSTQKQCIYGRIIQVKLSRVLCRLDAYMNFISHDRLSFRLKGLQIY